MGKYFSDKTERGIDLVWMQYDREKILEGRRLLEEAAGAMSTSDDYICWYY